MFEEQYLQTPISLRRTLHNSAEYTVLLMAHEIFRKIDHMFGHKTSLNRLPWTEMLQNLFSRHNTLQQKVKNKNIARRIHPQQCLEVKQFVSQLTGGERGCQNGK